MAVGEQKSKAMPGPLRIFLGKLGSLGREFRAFRGFRAEFRRFAALPGSQRRFRLYWEERYPCLNDRTAGTGFDPHYLYHTAWAVRQVAQYRPESHVDISSTLYFCTTLSAFVPVRFYDYRPARLQLPGLVCDRADLLALPFVDGSIASLSCMHVVEHVGLGRYGDPLDPDGDLKAVAELKRVLAPGGTLLFVVPVGGTARCLFNAHRIYTYNQVRELFAELELVEFALVQDGAADSLVTGTAELADLQEYGCGCFRFRKVGR